MNLYVVAHYEQWREYGGPEEGGWWYTCQQLIDCDSAWANEDVAWAKAQELNEGREYRAWQDATEVYTVVELGRREPKPELADFLCHSYEELDEERDYVTRWDIPEYQPERRPHYC